MTDCAGFARQIVRSEGVGHFLSFHRATPDPNALQWPFVGLVLAVVILRLAAFATASARPRDLRRPA